jgi:hypothetical protein
MPVRPVDDKPSDTLVVVSGEGFWTGSSTLPHLHQHASRHRPPSLPEPGFVTVLPQQAAGAQGVGRGTADVPGVQRTNPVPSVATT